MAKKYLILVLIVLVILEISGVGYLAVWREPFWTSVSDKNLHNFVYYLSQFCFLALALVFISGYKGYVINYLSLLVRSDLTHKAISDVNEIEGHRQRIQEDCRDYPLYSINLILGFLSAVIMSLVYITIILRQSSGLTLGIVLVYTLIGTCIASYIARPLIDLNYKNQVTEAAFRQSLSYLDYQQVFTNNWLLYIRLKYLQYFQSFFNQITVIVPLLILAPSYFGGMITFGVLMQLSACIASLIDQGSFFVNSFDTINRWLSCSKRLKEMKIL